MGLGQKIFLVAGLSEGERFPSGVSGRRSLRYWRQKSPCSFEFDSDWAWRQNYQRWLRDVLWTIDKHQARSEIGVGCQGSSFSRVVADLSVLAFILLTD